MRAGTAARRCARPGPAPLRAAAPSGVGLGRQPPLWMVGGDVCEVEIEGVGLLSNPIREEG